MAIADSIGKNDFVDEILQRERIAPNHKHEHADRYCNAKKSNEMRNYLRS
jgi:hypothetical protein